MWDGARIKLKTPRSAIGLATDFAMGPGINPQMIYNTTHYSIEYKVRVFLYQVYQARLWERSLNRSASLAMSTTVRKALPGKLNIKRHTPSILYL